MRATNPANKIRLLRQVASMVQVEAASQTYKQVQPFTYLGGAVTETPDMSVENCQADPRMLDAHQGVPHRSSTTKRKSRSSSRPECLWPRQSRHLVLPRIIGAQRKRPDHWMTSCSTIGEGGDTTIPSPGRSPKHPLPGIGLHDPLHGRQACPEFKSFHQGVGQICPRSGLFSGRSLSKRRQICYIPSPPQSLNGSDLVQLCPCNLV